MLVVVQMTRIDYVVIIVAAHVIWGPHVGTFMVVLRSLILGFFLLVAMVSLLILLLVVVPMHVSTPIDVASFATLLEPSAISGGELASLHEEMTFLHCFVA